MRLRKCPRCKGKGKVKPGRIDQRSLTFKQKRFLATYWRMKEALGRSPVYRELAAELGLMSLATVNQYIQKLRKAGVIYIEGRGAAESFSRLTARGKMVLRG